MSVAVLCIAAASEAPVTREWSRLYDGPARREDVAVAMTVDGWGNVYLAGSSMGKGTGMDFVTIKYDDTGNRLWVRRYDGPARSDDHAAAIAPASDGGVYVTGSSTTARASPQRPRDVDVVTVRYDSEGNMLWLSRTDGESRSIDQAHDMGLDGEGNVYVAGTASRDGGSSCFIVKYDAGGQEQWKKLSAGSGQVLAVDHEDAGVCVAGTLEYASGAGSDADLLITKYSCDTGEVVWSARHEVPGDGRWATTRDMLIDRNRRLYVCGASSRDGVLQGAVVWFVVNSDNTGRVVSSPYPGDSEDVALALGNDGRIYAAGYAVRATDVRADYKLTVLRPMHTSPWRIWTAFFNGPGRGTDRASAISVDAAGNAYLTGRSESRDSLTQYDCATVKFDGRTGRQLWVQREDGSARDSDCGVAVKVDASGAVYVACTMDPDQDSAALNNDLGIVKYVQAP